MNIQQAKQQFTMHQVLSFFNLFPAKISGDKIFYHAIDGRIEKTASLLVSDHAGYDFGSAKNYDVISVIQELKKCSVKEALEFLAKQPSNSVLPVKDRSEKLKNSDGKLSNRIKILSVKRELNYSLKKYLYSRKISEKNFKYLKQVDYVLENINSIFYAIGFENDSGSFELRSKIFKGCNGKDITTILNQSRTINVFESFIDFLSFLEIFGNLDEDFLVLNSTAMKWRAYDFLKDKSYDRIKIFTDLDFSGDEVCKYFSGALNNVSDNRNILLQDGKKYKDVNDLLCEISIQ